MRNEIIKILKKKLNKNVFFLTGDLGFGVVEVIKNKKNFFNCGASEQNMILVATGLALEKNTVIIYSIGNFPSLRCLEQIRNTICYHNLNVKIISIGAGFSYGSLGFTHHAIEDAAIIDLLPNISSITPATNFEAKELFKTILSDKNPYYLRLSKNVVNYDPDLKKKVDLRKPIEYSRGKKIAFLVTGCVIEEVKNVMNIIQKRNKIKCSIYSIPSPKLIDINILNNILKKYKKIVTVQESIKDSGLDSLVKKIQFKNKFKKNFISLSVNKKYYNSNFGSQRFYRDKNDLSEYKIYKSLKL